MEVGLKFTNGSPSINVYYAVDKEDGSRQYLLDGDKAKDQQNADFAFKVSSQTQWFPSDVADKLSSSGHLYLLFEGVDADIGDLTLMIKPKNGSESEGPSIRMWLKPVRKLYEHWKAGEGNSSVGNRDRVDASIAALYDQPRKDSYWRTFKDDDPETDDVIVFVHGWRLKDWQRDKGFGHTSYKRLWHSGFKGRFVYFSWPTGYTDRSTLPGNPPEDTDNYPDSEEIAYHSGANALKGLLDQLNQKYSGKVRMFAHSMGGIVASEALFKGGNVHTYAACQTAMVGHAYNASLPNRIKHPILGDNEWETPDVYGRYVPTGNPYYKSLVGKIYNFYNEDDAALKGWELGQTWKPNSSEGYKCKNFDEAANTGDFFHRSRSLTFPADRYETFAHAAEGRSFALGATNLPGAKGNFNLKADFSDRKYRFTTDGSDHSGQWNATMMLRHEFWSILVEDAFDIQLNED